MADALKASVEDGEAARDKALASIEGALSQTLLDKDPAPIKADEAAATSESVPGEEVARNLFAFLNPTAVANDDVASIGAHLSSLRRGDERDAERRAGLTAAAWIAATTVLLLIFWQLGLLATAQNSFLIVLFTVFTTVNLYLIVSAASRQRSTQRALGQLLRLASNLAEPSAIERQRLALVPEHFKAEIAALGQSVSSVGDRVSMETRRAREEIMGVAESFKTCGEGMNRSLEGLAIERAAIVTSGESLRHVLATVHSNMSRDLSNISTSLNGLFSNKMTALIETIDVRNKEFVNSYRDMDNRSLTALKDALDQALVRAMERHEVGNDRFLSSLTKRQDDFDAKLDRHLREAFTRSDKQITDFCDRTSHLSQTASREIEDLLRRTEEATEKTSLTLQRTFASNIIELSQSFKKTAAGLEDTVRQASRTLSEYNSQIDTATDGVNASIDQFGRSVIHPLDHLTTTFGEKSRTVAGDVLAQIDALNNVLGNATQRIRAEFVAGEVRLSETASRTVEDVRAKLSDLSADIARVQDRGFAAMPAPQAQPVRGRLDLPSEAAVSAPPPAPPVMPEEPTSPQVGVRMPVDRRTWITDLLDRVDAAGPVKPVALTVPKSIELISFVVDGIDDLLMTDEVVRAWDRFRDGEESSFDTIFTPAGAAASEKVTAQIASDAVLKDFVQAYLARFELLLKDAYSAGDDGALSSYMSSEGGKIYTFLAKSIKRI